MNKYEVEVTVAGDTCRVTVEAKNGEEAAHKAASGFSPGPGETVSAKLIGQVWGDEITTYGNAKTPAFLVACPGLSNLLMVEAENPKQAAEFAACEMQDMTCDATGEYKVYPVCGGFMRADITGATFNANQAGEVE